MTFDALDVRPEVVRALKEIDIVEPTNIQKEAIPLAHDGRDMIGMSKTGSGKTAAFGIPLVEKVKKGEGVQALVLAPTRELAIQIAGELEKFGKYLDVSIATVFGGVSINPQIDKIAKSEIVVGTPGRILDHLGRETLDISELSLFVLDEADRMVDMGFIDDIVEILDHTPESQQMFLFGATMSKDVDYIRNNYMNDAVDIKVESQVQAEQLAQFYYNVRPHEKFSLLVHLLKKDKHMDGAIVFCSTRATVELVAHNLRKQGFKPLMIHGKLSQNKRMEMIDKFNKQKGVLVASSVAARGLHIDDVTHVFNYDLSQDAEEYIHRIGRTARAGETGVAVTLLSNDDHDTFAEILRRYDIEPEAKEPEKHPRLPFDTRRGNRERREYGGGRGPRRGGPRGRNDRRSGPPRRSRGSSSRIPVVG
ncbi:MAG: DEAD/DEAH box helicase [Nanoarchaeota archaeon]